jgi:metallo-beta-lactamase family protein
LRSIKTRCVASLKNELDDAALERVRSVGGRPMQLRFLGGAGSVTGSKVIVEYEGRRLLLDCGLFQGLKQLRLHNRSALAVPSRSIDAVVLAQAHLAHSGFLPRLVELGFEGPVHATPATVELCQLLLPEAGRLLEEEARQANLLGYSRHSPARPLYTEAMAVHALQRLQPRRYDELFEPVPGFVARLRPAGQALGAASVHLRCGSHSLLYAGALGRVDDPLLREPVPAEAADQLLVEATYGNRQHRLPDAMARLSKLICRTAARGGVVLLPAHAAGPAQLLLHALRQLKSGGRIPDLPVHLDSRIAVDVVSIYQRHTDELRIDSEACQTLLQDVKVAQDTEEALALSRIQGPAIVIAIEDVAYGRALAQHLKLLLPDARNAIAFSSYQPAGTRGAALLAGKPQIKVQGLWITARAEVIGLDGLSGHADRQGLLDWVLTLPRAPKHVYLMQGEPEAADSLRQAIAERQPWACSVPEYLELANIREDEALEHQGMPG